MIKTSSDGIESTAKKASAAANLDALSSCHSLNVCLSKLMVTNLLLFVQLLQNLFLLNEQITAAPHLAIFV